MAPVPIRITGLLCGGLLLLCAGPAQAAPFKVSIRVEAKSKTLVEERRVTVSEGEVVKDGDPAHACDGQAAIGALHQGTGGDWEGSWSEGMGYFVTAIADHKPRAPGYWEMWINRRQATAGICDAELEPGDDVLFFVQDCEYVPALERCRNPVLPLGVRVASTIRRGDVKPIRVVRYKPNGKAAPAAGARVFVNGERIGRTDEKGTIDIKGTDLGSAEVHAVKAGHVRSETERFRVVR